MKNKRAITELKRVQRSGNNKVSRRHLDMRNRNIYRSSQKTSRQRTYKGS